MVTCLLGDIQCDEELAKANGHKAHADTQADLNEQETYRQAMRQCFVLKLQ